MGDQSHSHSLAAQRIQLTSLSIRTLTGLAKRTLILRYRSKPDCRLIAAYPYCGFATLNLNAVVELFFCHPSTYVHRRMTSTRAHPAVSRLGNGICTFWLALCMVMGTLPPHQSKAQLALPLQSDKADFYPFFSQWQ